VLGETLRQFHPDWALWLCLADEEPPGFDFDPSGGQFDLVIRLNELDIPGGRRWIFDHEMGELCAAVNGSMLSKLLDEDAGKVVYLAPQMALLDDLSPIALLLDRWNVVLTPHQFEADRERSATLDAPSGSLGQSRYTPGFLAVAGTAEGRRFARWWRDRLHAFCFDDIPDGLFTDQRWCEYVPVFFEGVHILRDAGCNVASGNLIRRLVTIEEDGTVRAAGHQVRLVNFSDITHVEETTLERYAGDRIEAFELMQWYRRRLAAHGVRGVPEAWWAYAHYADGTRIAREHRLMYRRNGDLRRRYPDPFLAGPQMFGR
jgi:hypothetical protein